MQSEKTKFAVIGKNRNSKFSMAHRIYGTGPIKVMLIMGALSQGKNWTSTVEHFKKQPSKYSVCTFDHVGIGESSYSSLTSINDMASDTLELMDHLKWDKVHIISISKGSLIAYELSLIAPERILSLNLSSITPNIIGNIFFTPAVQRLIKVDLHSFLHGIDKSTLVSNIMFSQSYLESDSKIKNGKNKQFVLPLTEKLANELDKIPINVKIAHLWSMIKYRIKVSQNSKQEALKRPFPIAMFFGTHDSFIDWKTAIKTYDAIKPNILYICKDAGHALYAEDVETFNTKSEQFFSFNKTNHSTIHVPLQYNSNTQVEDHFQHLKYQSTPIQKLPIILTSIHNFKKSNIFEKLSIQFLFTFKKIIK